MRLKTDKDKICPKQITIKLFCLTNFYFGQQCFFYEYNNECQGAVMASNPPVAFTLAINPPDRKYVPFAKFKKIKPLWARLIKISKLTTEAIINKIRRRILIDSYDIRVK